MKLPTTLPAHKKVLFPVLGVILLTGVSATALHSNFMDNPEPLKQTQIAQSGIATAPTVTDEDTAIAVAQTDALSRSEQNTNASTQEASDTPEPTTPTAFQSFHEYIASQARALAPMFVPAYFATENDFVSYQTYCLERGLGEDSAQADMDSKLSFLVPQATDDGRIQYQFFTGGCRVVQFKR